MVIAGVRADTFGMALQLLLWEKRFTQAQVARMAGVSRATVNRVCNGHRPLTPWLAQLIEQHTGIGAQGLLDLQACYESVHKGGAAA